MSTGQYISLHCYDARSDKDYDMQLHQEDDGSWSVTAQHGRHGAKLRHMVKVERTSYSAAWKVFDDLKQEKLGKGYTHVGIKGESLRLYNVHKERQLKSAPQPDWTGWEDCLQEAQSALGTTSPDEKHRMAYVLIGDLSQMMQEGFSDAMAFLTSDSYSLNSVSSQISPECKAWWTQLPKPLQGEIYDVATALAINHKAF